MIAYNNYPGRYGFEEELFVIYPGELRRAMEIISLFKGTITDCEINKGTLNDVFLSITGKEIRC